MLRNTHYIYIFNRFDFCLFDLILYVPVTKCLVMSGQVFLVEPVLSLAQGYNVVTPVWLKLTTLGLRSSTLPLNHSGALPIFNRFDFGDIPVPF